MHRFYKWRDALNAAPDEEVVRKIVRDYLDSLEPRMVSMLPTDCQTAISNASRTDLQTLAVVLLRAELSWQGTHELGRYLHEIAHTLAAASVRVSHLRDLSRVRVP